jgi:hypothetical protein
MWRGGGRTEEASQAEGIVYLESQLCHSSESEQAEEGRGGGQALSERMRPGHSGIHIRITLRL